MVVCGKRQEFTPPLITCRKLMFLFIGYEVFLQFNKLASVVLDKPLNKTPRIAIGRARGQTMLLPNSAHKLNGTFLGKFCPKSTVFLNNN